MYRITDYSKEKAKELNVEIKPSTRKHKKIDVYKNNKLVASIGDKRYMKNDYPNYVKSHGIAYAEKRKSLFNMRHRKNASKINSPAYFASKILW
jgi:hypothetical protein